MPRVEKNNKRKLFVLVNLNRNETKTIEKIFSQVPKGFWIWISLILDSHDLAKSIEDLAKFGFQYPYITDITPLGKQIEHSISLSRLNDSKMIDPYQTILYAKYVLKQYKTHGGKGCSVFSRFSEDALKFLNDSCYNGYTENKDGSSSQKEIGGVLRVIKIEKGEDESDNIFVIGVDKKRIEYGIEEEIDLDPTRYNFHSHPKSAYVKHNVTTAWPSVTDFLGYLGLGNSTIFHCVVSLEGIYIISFSDYWVKRITEKENSEMINFIKKNLDLKYSNSMSPFQFAKKVNHILYKNHPIFIVKFLPWGNEVRTVFSVSYAGTKSSKSECETCIPTEDLLSRYMFFQK